MNGQQMGHGRLSVAASMATLLITTGLFATGLLAPVVVAFAAADDRPHIPPELLGYFDNRYDEIGYFKATLCDTPDGPAGDISIRGHLRPKDKGSGTAPPREARAIARDFIEREADLLGITDLSQIHEGEVRQNGGGTAVLYFRRIGGLDLMGAEYSFFVENGGAIHSIYLGFVPVSADLVSALKRPTIGADKVVAIVEENLGGRQQPPDAAVKAVQRWATWREPFVIWTATASRQGLSAWNYSIDAFTGQILRKDCPVHGMTMASAPGQTPCGPIGFEPPAGAASLMPTPEWLAACVAAQGGAKGSAPAAAVLGAGAVSTPKTGAVPDYSIQAIRYATVPRFPLSGLMMGAPEDQTVDIAMVVWLVRGGGHNVLFDTGFHRDKWMKEFTITDFLRPDEAVALAGVRPEEITDVVISHAHWDHMGGVDLFPKAQVWIQKQEYAYYSGDAWQPGGRHGGIDPEDVAALVQVNTEGRLHFVDGDGVEILPGIRAYTGARHTYASQYLRIDGATPYVLASDNCYLFSNLSEHVASATFDDGDRAANLKAQSRMIDLAGSPDRVIPGHDPRQFERFPTEGRVARIH